jgi:hypothetical protein
MNCPKLLKDAIEGLYSAFSAYPLPEETFPCPCCHAGDANALLHAASLRELQWEHLAEYSTDALMVWGNLDCYKHFLPRIFELVLTTGEWPQTPTPERVFGILRYGNWRSWPRNEQDAIETMLRAVWTTILSNPPIDGGYIDVDQWLCCISQCESDLNPYLDEWINDERVSSAWALSSWILGSEIAYTGPGTEHDPPAWVDASSEEKIKEWSNQPHSGAFWKHCRAQYAQLEQWLKSPAILDKLKRAELASQNLEIARELETAQRCIQEAPTMKFERVYKKRLYQTAYWDSPTYRLY